MPRARVPLDQRSGNAKLWAYRFWVCAVVLIGSSGYANKTNMAERTPKTTLSSHVCRCCNCSFLNNPIDLFGAKSEALLEKVTGLSIEFDDGFPKKICRSCYNRVKQFAEFKGTMSPHVHAQVDEKHFEIVGLTFSNTVREFRRLLYRIGCKRKRISTGFEKLSIFYGK